MKTKSAVFGLLGLGLVPAVALAAGSDLTCSGFMAMAEVDQLAAAQVIEEALDVADDAAVAAMPGAGTAPPAPLTDALPLDGETRRIAMQSCTATPGAGVLAAIRGSVATR